MRYDSGEEIDIRTAGPDPMDELLERDMVRHVRRAIEVMETLRPEHALILTLRHGLEGEPHTYAKVQAATGLKYSAVRSREWRACNVLRCNRRGHPFMGVPGGPTIGFGHHLLPGG
jgi:DNA-directed RNA polymerase sigma subunit (sigma70/sigma32)